MVDNSQIKKKARENFISNYWPSVGVLLVGVLLSSMLTMIPFVGWLLFIFFSIPITAGVSIVAMSIYNGKRPGAGMLFIPFSRYGRVLGGMLWMYLWMFLWGLIFAAVFIPVFIITNVMMYASAVSLYSWQGMAAGAPVAVLLICLSFLGIVPLIIKALSYFCTPYILGLFPEVQATDALEISKKIMDGNKGRLFLLMLSFIGWVLIPIAVSIAMAFAFPLFAILWYPLFMVLFYGMWIFFTGPYYMTSLAGFFDNVKNAAVQNGVITAEMLEGKENVGGGNSSAN